MRWKGQDDQVVQGCPADEFRLLALDRLVPLLVVLPSVVLPWLEVPLLEVPLWEVLAVLPEEPLLVEPWEEVLLVVALLEALGAGL